VQGRGGGCKGGKERRKHLEGGEAAPGSRHVPLPLLRGNTGAGGEGGRCLVVDGGPLRAAHAVQRLLVQHLPGVWHQPLVPAPLGAGGGGGAGEGQRGRWARRFRGGVGWLGGGGTCRSIPASHVLVQSPWGHGQQTTGQQLALLTHGHTPATRKGSRVGARRPSSPQPLHQSARSKGAHCPPRQRAAAGVKRTCRPMMSWFTPMTSSLPAQALPQPTGERT
jgi:hypothetical protein